MKINIYKKNPVTGQDANDVSGIEDGGVFSDMVANGCQFYWTNKDGEWSRVELNNFEFAMDCMGRKVVIN